MQYWAGWTHNLNQNAEESKYNNDNVRPYNIEIHSGVLSTNGERRAEGALKLYIFYMN